MNAFDVLGDPVRRRIIELLAGGEARAGDVAERIHAEFGISQPGVSAHLRVLRDAGFTTVRVDGTRRMYSVAAEPLDEIADWLRRHHHRWSGALDALGTEIARGKRGRKDDQR